MDFLGFIISSISLHPGIFLLTFTPTTNDALTNKFANKTTSSDMKSKQLVLSVLQFSLSSPTLEDFFHEISNLKVRNKIFSIEVAISFFFFLFFFFFLSFFLFYFFPFFLLFISSFSSCFFLVFFFCSSSFLFFFFFFCSFLFFFFSCFFFLVFFSCFFFFLFLPYFSSFSFFFYFFLN